MPLLGLICEGARTNLCTYSNGFDNAAWSKLNSGTGAAPVVTPNYAVAPDGTTTAYRLQLNRGAGAGSGNYSILRSTAASGLANPHTSAESLWVKTTSGGTATILFGSSYAAGFSVTVTSEWTRLDKSQSVPQTIDSIDIYLRDGVSLTNDQSADILIFGAQLELGSFASSYIATTTIAVARNADVLTYSVDLSSGSLYAEVTPSNVDTANGFTFVSLSGGAVNKQVLFDKQGGAAYGSLYVRNTTDQAFINIGNYTANTVNKVAGRFAANDFAGLINGGTVATDTNGTLSAMTQLNVGTDFANSTSAFGTIRNVRIWQRQLSASELQAITA